MQPIPETIEAAALLDQYDPDFQVLEHLQETADRVQALVPDCMGLSIAWSDQQVAFTLVASDEEIAVLDAMQYLGGGPCVEAASRDHGLEAHESDLMDEERWRLFAMATAHHGVASTLTFQLVERDEVVGTVNLYGGSACAFEGHHEDLAAILGTRAWDVVRNADLTFSTREAAEETPAALRGQHEIDVAVGLLIGALGLTADAALLRLTTAAARSGVPARTLARAMSELYRDHT